MGVKLSCFILLFFQLNEQTACSASREALQAENEKLAHDYDEIAEALHAAQVEGHQAKRLYSTMIRDNKRLQTHIEDLSQQVKANERLHNIASVQKNNDFYFKNNYKSIC